MKAAQKYGKKQENSSITLTESHQKSMEQRIKRSVHLPECKEYSIV